MDGKIDPYFSGQASGHSLEAKRLGPAQRPPVHAWLNVYLANLVVPVCFGLSWTRDAGRAGMVVGILLVFALGCRACFISRRAVLAVVYGGWVVALTQLCPSLHVFAGTIGIMAAGPWSLPTDHGLVSLGTVLGGLIATTVTGGILLAVATILGLMIQGVIAWYRGHRVASKAARPVEASS